MLKIAHIGGTQQVKTLLKREQAAKGHLVELESLEGLKAENYDILHLHGNSILELFSQKKIFAEKKREQSPALIFTSYDDAVGATHAPAYKKEVLDSFAAIFTADAFYHKTADKLTNYSWTSLPLEIPGNITIKDYDSFSGTIRIFYIRQESQKDQLNLLSKTVQEINCKTNCIELVVKQQHENLNIAKDLGECDVFIDYFDGYQISYNSLLALAAGKTVLAPMSEDIRKMNSHFQFAPILDTNHENINKRLQALAKEPKCMRDFYIRGQEYIRQFHDPKIISNSLLEIYEQVLS